MKQEKPQLSFFQIWNMCFGFLGIQFGFALQNANVPRIFQTLGANIEELPILYIAAPITGLLVQPIIGYMSDKTWNRFGRRRPYFLFGAIIASLALFIIPNSPYLWVAAGMLWILDASINITMEPFRAFVSDMLPQKQRTLGYVTQSFFIGIGSVIASTLPWIFTNWFDVSNIPPEGGIADSVKYSFYVGGGIYLAAVLWSVFSTKEYTPEQLAAFNHAEKESKSFDAIERVERTDQQIKRMGKTWLGVGILSTTVIFWQGWEPQLFVISGGCIILGTFQFICLLLKSRGTTEHGFFQIFEDLFHMPRAMKQLAIVQFFSWFALFCLWIYSTPAVTSFHFGSDDPMSALYNEGADWVGILFACFNGFAALAAFFIPVVARLTNLRIAHMINMFLGALGLISMLWIKDPYMLWISMIGIGIAWASILSLPYSLLSNSLPSEKMGVYIGIFNFFIVIPQILAASILGLLVHYVFEGQAIYALVLGGGLMVCAGIAVLFVDEN